MKKYLSIFLIFFLLFSVSVPAFAQEYLPPIVSDYGCDSYIINENDSGGCGTVAFVASDWTIFYQSTGFNGSSVPFLIFYPKVDNPSTVYNKGWAAGYYDPENPNNGWEALAPITPSTVTRPDGSSFPYIHLNYDGRTIYSSSIDIPYGELTDNNTNYVLGDVFFSAIPPLEVVTEEALTQFQIQTSQTMMIILLCGVGCLALLISLPVLRKVLFRFLNK